jgi:hypothetical protein
VEIFSPKEGTVKLEIVPYVVGDGNPYARKGELYYERTFFVHKRIGPNNETYVCPAKTAKRPCPICEYRAALAKDGGDEKQIKALKPKEQQLWLLHVLGKDSDDKKVQLFVSSFYTFGRLLDKKRHDADDDETHITDFDDPDAGAVLKCSWSEEDAGGYTFLDCYSIDFKPRPNGIDKELLDHGICLDSVVKILPYEELKRLHEGGDEDDGDDDGDDPVPKAKPKAKAPPPEDDDDELEPKPKPKKFGNVEPPDDPPDDAPTAKDAGLEEGMMVRHRKAGVCEIIRISKDGTSLILQDGNEEIHKGVGVADVRKMEKAPPKEEEEPPPKPKAKAPPKEEDDWDNEPPPKAKPKAKAPPPDDDDDEPPPKAKAKAKAAKGDTDPWD